MRRWTIWSHPWRTVPLRLSCSAIVWIHWIRYPQVLDCQRLIWGVKTIRWPRILLSLTWNRIHRCSLFLYSFFYVVNVEFGIKCLLLSLLLLSVNLFVLWSFVLRIVYYFSFFNPFRSCDVKFSFDLFCYITSSTRTIFKCVGSEWIVCWILRVNRWCEFIHISFFFHRQQ